MAAALSPDRLWRRLRWEWQRRGAQQAWMPWLALLLTLLAMACGFDTWQQGLTAASPEVVQPARHVAPPLDPVAQARHDLDHFYKGLPPARALSAPLLAVLRLGDKHGVHFSEGEYHQVSNPDAPLVEEDIILPATASPDAIQDFVHEAMQSLRPLTVTGLSFERDDVNAAVVKARIHFVLWARGN